MQIVKLIIRYLTAGKMYFLAMSQRQSLKTIVQLSSTITHHPSIGKQMTDIQRDGNVGLLYNDLLNQSLRRRLARRRPSDSH